jgi:hypothetical protein
MASLCDFVHLLSSKEVSGSRDPQGAEGPESTEGPESAEGPENAEDAKNAKAWGSHGHMHLGFLKPSKTSYIFLNI